MPFVIYSVLRIAVLVICAVVLYALGMRGWLYVGASLVLALGVSYAALAIPRTKASEYLVARRERRAGGRRFSDTQEEDFASEDAQIDAERADATDSDSAGSDATDSDSAGSDATDSDSAGGVSATEHEPNSQQ